MKYQQLNSRILEDYKRDQMEDVKEKIVFFIIGVMLGSWGFVEIVFNN